MSFFAVVFAWSWSFWIMAAASGITVEEPAGQTLKLAGLLGPTVAGVGFTLAAGNKAAWRDYWLRLIDPRRISPRWYIVIFLFAPVLLAVSALLDITFGGTSTVALIEQRCAPFLSNPLTAIPFVLGVLVNGPLPEELGWRGYALDRLQARWNALTASLILGAFWSVWHIPLFFMSGMRHAGHGPWTAWFWLFIVAVIPTSVIFGWIFNNTRRSILAAVLFHTVANAAYDLLNVTDATNLYACLLWILAAVAIVLKYGPATFSGKNQPTAAD